MCTLTWRAAHECGYDLFFNRDELNTRGGEEPPRIETIDDVVFASPRDSDRGGTWLLVNAHGVTVALLNDYGATWRPKSGETISRGAVVLACAAATTPGSAVARIGRMSLERAGAFKVVVLGPDGRGSRLHWKGESLLVSASDGIPFETSSSFETERVCASRRRRFEALAAEGGPMGCERLTAFHWEHDVTNGAASVLMRRTDARTRSVTRVSVRADFVEMYYQPVGEHDDPRPATSVNLRFPRL